MPTTPRKRATKATGTAAADAPVLSFSPDPGSRLAPIGVQTGPPASHRFRVQRGRDLVNLQVSAYGCELVRAGEASLLRATGPTARLEVRLPFQHIGEESFVEGHKIVPPVRARAAGGSRLVFRLPEHEAIEYSVEGFLAALRRLPLIVVPAAQPKPPPSRRVEGVVLAVLPGGFALLRAAEGLVLTPVTKKQLAVLSPASRTGVGRVLASTVELQVARQVLARESAIDLTKGKVPDLAHLLVPPAVSRKIRGRPRAPRSDETALEAPYRLVLSPSALGGFTHADAPVEASSGRVELWHSRLGVRVERDGAAGGGAPIVTVDEVHAQQRVVRAVWARDLEAEEPPTKHEDVPFRMPLDGRDRTVLVTQTSDPASLTPLIPVDAHKLYVSSLGAYLNLSGYWPQDDQTGVTPEILSWDHIAPMGRDQFVKVVYPGYLFPFGHTAALVKQTTRQVGGAPPVAGLRTEFFLVVTSPVNSYDGDDMPFKQIRVRPLVSPGILDPNEPGSASEVPRKGQKGYGQLLFWPKLTNGQDLDFVLECLDNDGRTSRLTTPLLFVGQTIGDRDLEGTPPPRPPRKNESRLVVTFPEKSDVVDAWNARPPIPAQGQSIAFATSAVPGQTSMQTATLTFSGTPADPPRLSSIPGMVRAAVVVPAIEQLGPPGAATATDVIYPETFLTHGFGSGNSVLEQFLQVEGRVEVDFTTGSDRGGGFLAPNLGVHALTRKQGAVGKVAGYTPAGFDPAQAFDLDLLPKLFGIFSLTDLLGKNLPVPSFVGTALDDITALLADLAALEAAADEAVKRLSADAGTAATQGLRDAAQAALTTLTPQVGLLAPAMTAFTAALDALQDLAEAADPATVPAKLGEAPKDLREAVEKIQTALGGVTLPTAARAAVERPLATLLPLLRDAEELVRGVAAIVSGVRDLSKAGLDSRASYTWSTPLTNFPAGPADNALFVAEQVGKDRSTLSMAVTAGPSGADVTAEITDFALNLFPGAPLVRLVFDRLAFSAAAGKKADVDVVFEGVEFQGVLGFVNTLKDLVPFDGFSDPPYLDVDTAGLKAGFDLALPSVAVGVFALENISLHAGLNIPFLGEALTVGFAFCTREKPFRLTVLMIGGGGFVGITLSPKGLVVLEMSLEAGACLSINLGVASGSVSVMVGVYLRLEGEAGSLTGYFRIRGEVDVLGLISASITLELSLTYHFASGKLIGRASVEVEVEVFLVSFSVSVSCERKLAGSNGDPTYAQVLSLDSATGTAPEWDAYCAAFAAD